MDDVLERELSGIERELSTYEELIDASCEFLEVGIKMRSCYDALSQLGFSPPDRNDGSPDNQVNRKWRKEAQKILVQVRTLNQRAIELDNRILELGLRLEPEERCTSSPTFEGGVKP